MSVEDQQPVQNLEPQAEPLEDFSKISDSFDAPELDNLDAETDTTVENDENTEDVPWKPKKKKDSKPEDWLKDRLERAKKKSDKQSKALEAQNNMLLKRIDKFESVMTKYMSGEDVVEDVDNIPVLDIETPVAPQPQEQPQANAPQKPQMTEYQRATQAEKFLVKAVVSDLPDYYEVVENSNPELLIKPQTASRLEISPALPYLKYKIAKDPDFLDELQSLSVDELDKTLRDTHDEIIDILKAKSQAPAPQGRQPQKQPRPNSQAPRKPAKKPAPKAPPRGNSSGAHGKKLSDLEGDAYIREYTRREGLGLL